MEHKDEEGLVGSFPSREVIFSCFETKGWREGVLPLLQSSSVKDLWGPTEEDEEKERTWFYLCILAFASEDHDFLQHFFSKGVNLYQSSSSALLYEQMNIYFQQQQKRNIYSSGAAFEAFIEKGGNVPMYQSLSRLFRQNYKEGLESKRNDRNKEEEEENKEDSPFCILDIGVGSGKALLPSLFDDDAEENKNCQMKVELIEPSASLLTSCIDALRSSPSSNSISFTAHNLTIQEFMQNKRREEEELQKENDSNNWDIIQASFALHNLPIEDCGNVMKWAHHCLSSSSSSCATRRRGGRMLIAEFDVPPSVCLSRYSPAFVEHVRTTYPKGLAEYEDAEHEETTSSCFELVAQGFLVPIMLGYFARSQQQNTTYERPVEAWQNELLSAGFARVETHVIYRYWWADAVLLVASC
ncbi:hypothetical protein QOT17_010957 [Balamuthia mandrillaris]